MDNSKLDSIKSKILKLHALAESGNTHEAMNARAMLEKWLCQYGLSLDDILSEKEELNWYMFKVSTNWEKKLLFQCYCMIKNTSNITYKKGTKVIALELTSYEFAEITNYYEWHRKQLGKELKELQQNFVSAYTTKHGLFSDCNENETPKSLTPDDLKRIKKVLTLMRAVEDTHFHKLLEQ